jgi:sensor histidine kinase regulating citrate/malate metabolism
MPRKNPTAWAILLAVFTRWSPLYRRYAAVHKFLRFVLDKVYSGIIVCKEHRQIIFMNKVYADLLKTDPKPRSVKDIKEYFPGSRLSQVIPTGIPELGQRRK